jgi:pimeloyl-ACP methyl ester carboxylesterase
MAESLALQHTTARNAAPLVIGSSNGPLFAFYHPPQGEARGTGVVLCNPLGYESNASHHAYREIAQRLAARGFPALRFDYHGTGDSSGQADQADRVQAWLDSIDAAVVDLRERAGVRSVALFGVRFGATLAAVAAAKRGDIDKLLLWAPLPSGRAYIREMRALRMIKEPGGQPNPRLNGGEESGGYYFDKQTLADLSAIDLAATKQRTAAHVLLVPRDDLPGAESRLAKHFESTGAEVRVTSDAGYGLMMRDPHESVVPTGTLERMIDWLSEGRNAEPLYVPAPKSTASSLILAGANGARVREQSLLFGENQRLFGIVTEPVEKSARERPAVLFLNIGAHHHIGPSRLYVSLARALGSLGYLGFRFDVAGLGESTLPPGAPATRLYSKDSVGDVRAAMSFIGERFGARRFVLVGLCSGAYMAFHTGLEDSRVIGQILMNPQAFEWNDDDVVDASPRKTFLSVRYYVRALMDPAAWRKAIRGDAHVRDVLLVLRDGLAARTRTNVERMRSLLHGQSARTYVERSFRLLCDRGVDSLLVFGSDDRGIDMIEGHLGRHLRRMRDCDNIKLEIVAGGDRTFTPIHSQVALLSLLTRHVSERFA